MKAFKVTLSGQYRLDNKIEFIEFENLTGIVPYNEEDIVTAHAIKRYVWVWLKREKKKYPKNPRSIRICRVDSLELCESDFDFVGRDIKEMSYEDLQDLACAKDIRAIPVFEKISLRDSRIQAYVAYSALVLGKPIKWQTSEFNFLKLPPLIVEDTSPRKDTTRVVNNEEFLDEAGKDDKVLPAQKKMTNLSRQDLEAIATSRDVKFNNQMTDEQLYKLLYQ